MSGHAYTLHAASCLEQRIVVVSTTIDKIRAGSLGSSVGQRPLRGLLCLLLLHRTLARLPNTRPSEIF
jgi:hypothetical protein